MPNLPSVVAFQGEPGAYSHAAVQELFPGARALPCPSFDAAADAVRERAADAAVLPIENSHFGRVTDLHHLLPESGLHITGEYFLPIRHLLLVLPGVTPAQVRTAYSHPQALGQCRHTLSALNITPAAAEDTAGAAKFLRERPDALQAAAIASATAAQLYNLEVLREVTDSPDNTTRFLVLRREPAVPDPALPCITGLVFRTRNIPAALYKALGGFATEGINLSKIESYQPDGRFAATQFYAEAETHPERPAAARALDELRFFSRDVRILGVYPAHAYRFQGSHDT